MPSAEATAAVTEAESPLVMALREIGDVVAPDRSKATVALFAPLHEEGPPADVAIRRDVSYGPHARHRLDVFLPLGAAEGALRPVVLFVHGGNFVAGDKHTAGSPFYDNVGIWAARQGFVGATMSYRLAPEVAHPAGAEDVAAAVRCLQALAGEIGGDGGRIVLVGASAGAVHVATYLASAARADGVAGAALLAGMYDLVEFGDRAVLDRYYGAGADLAALSPLAGLVGSGVPLLASVAEFDPPDRHRQWALLATAVQARTGRVPAMVYLPEHNHFSQVLHLGTADDRLSTPLAQFITGLPTG